VAFLLAVATPLQIRRLAAHFVQNRPEIGARVRPTHGANWRRAMHPLRVWGTANCRRCVTPPHFSNLRLSTAGIFTAACKGSMPIPRMWRGDRG
jgi:hypothetical protein